MLYSRQIGSQALLKSLFAASFIDSTAAALHATVRMRFKKINILTVAAAGIRDVGLLRFAKRVALSGAPGARSFE